MQMAEGRGAYIYDIADSAYNARQIREYSAARGRAVSPMGDTARFREQTAVEQSFAWLKERYGGRTVRVRGALKAMCHQMFGVVALTAARLFAAPRYFGRRQKDP
jgi:hypothetical protein